MKAWKRQCSPSTRKFLIGIFVLWNLWDILLVRHSLQHSQIAEPATPDGSRAPRIFIASTHWNTEKVLRPYWNAAVLKLAEDFGYGNVFVSAVEGGSFVDDTKGALRELAGQLAEVGVAHKFSLDETTHADEIARSPSEATDGWILSPKGSLELRRIPYLSRIRNLSLEPLYRLAAQGEIFDKILFLNDVVFTTKDVRTLLATNGGDYAAACSLDFSKAPAFYDTFALRDVEGHEPLMSTWPYFRARASRHAIKTNQPVPVSSCWNGMVVMDSTPFYHHDHPLSFRGIPDSLALSHLEGSECCLIHTDNPLTPIHGVWLNPNVRVGYNGPAYEQMNGERYAAWLSPWRVLWNLWENRVRRWTTSCLFKEWAVQRRVKAWEAEDTGRKESGEGVCLVNEMQVIRSYGWAHV